MATVQSTQTGTTSASKPTGTNANDLLVAIISRGGAAGETISAPTTSSSVVDSYPESNQDSTFSYGTSTTGGGQAFMMPGTPTTLTKATFYLSKAASPTGNAFAKIYAITGSLGSTAVPTGAVLATSDAVDVSTIGASLGLIDFNFSGAEQITLLASTAYAVVVEYTGSSGSNFIRMGYDASSPSHAGNRVTFIGGSWGAGSANDVCFYIYGGTAQAPWIKLDEQGQNNGASYCWGAVFYKLAGISEPSSYAFTSSGGAVNNHAIMRITGHNLTTPIESHQGTSNGTTSKTITLAGITPLTASSLIFIVACVIATTPTIASYAIATSDPGGWAEAFDINSGSLGQAAASAVRTQITATGNATAVYTSGDAADSRKVGFVFSIPPGIDTTISADLLSLTGSVLEPAFEVGVIDATFTALNADMSTKWGNSSTTPTTFSNQQKT